MKRLFSYLIVLLVWLFTGCENGLQNDKSFDISIILSEEDSYQIVNSDEFKNFMSLKLKFLYYVKRGLEKGYSIETLSDLILKSIKSGNDEEIFVALFDSYSNGEKYIRSLIEARRELELKFPILKSISPTSSPNFTKQGISHFLTRVEELNVNNMAFNSLRIMDVDPNKPVCGSY
ncbi:MAG TPA: hypothetical protein ENJ39_00795, partial [Flammeovirgaceae bacterium]|nr:hypothetical protein [Flammeovirgaceae bacterium]